MLCCAVLRVLLCSTMIVMKKTTLLATACATFLFFAAIGTACNNEKSSSDSNSALKKEQVKKDSTTNAASAAAGQAMPEPDFQTPDVAIEYIQTNADKVFAQIKPIADIIKKAGQGEEPNEKEKALLQDPNAVDPKFMDAILMLMQWTATNKITPEQDKQLTDFANTYKDGMADIGLLMQVAMMADGVGGAGEVPSAQAPAQ